MYLKKIDVSIFQIDQCSLKKHKFWLFFLFLNVYNWQFCQEVFVVKKFVKNLILYI